MYRSLPLLVLLVFLVWLTGCAGPRSRVTPSETKPGVEEVSEDQPTKSDGLLVTVRQTSLRARPAPGALTIAMIPSGTMLRWIAGEADHDFYLVAGERTGSPGWVRKGDLQVTENPLLAGFSAMAACATKLSECTPRGCAASRTPGAVLNELKHHIPAGSPKATLSFDDLASLQQQADGLVGSGRNDLSEAERAQLSGLSVAEGEISEGDPVRLLAYLPQDSSGPHPNSSGESVNCGLKGSASNDFHIPVTEDPSYTEFDGVVIEMIPQDRPETWTTSSLKKLQQAGTEVWIEGNLFYDNMHVVNNDAKHPIGGQPKRFSLWEVHPVTKFLVCRQAHCDPQDESTWTEL